MEKLQSLFKLPRRDSGYEKLAGEFSSAKRSRCHISTSTSRSSLFFQCTTIILLLISTLLSTALLMRVPDLGSRANDQPRPIKSCGSTVAEARLRNCQFDLLAKAWLPNECSRHGLDGFLAAGATLNNGTTWRYWTAKDGSVEIGQEDLSLMGDDGKDRLWWATRREHSVHCAWMLLRLAHAYTHGLEGDQLVRNYHHAEHCVNNLLQKSYFAPGQDEIATKGNVIFGDCYLGPQRSPRSPG